MASTQKFVEFVLDQIHDAGEISSRKMFGEYAIYADGKVVALVADDILFVKQTEGGKKFIGDYQEAPPYPGAKMCFLIEDQLEDHQFLSELIRITSAEVPFPKPKKSKKI